MLRSSRLALAAVLGLCALGASWDAAAQPAATDAQLLRPNPVEIEPGRHLHWACVGQGSPTVVFEQGDDGALTSWRKVLPAVAALTRACVYDRAGFGLSDPPKDPVSGISVTDDLRKLLHAADVRGPVVLVGSSIGGFYATMFANRFPQQVAGLVLVEPDFPGQFAPSAPRQRRRELDAMAKDAQHLAQCAELARQGKLSAEAPQGCFQPPADLTPEETGYVVAMMTRPGWYEASAEQADHFFPAGNAAESLDWRQERLARREFGDLPLVVLSAATPPRSSVQNDKAYAEFEQRWKDGHKALAARSKHGQWIEVPGAGHDLQLDQPQAVADAVQRVIAQARQSAPPEPPTKSARPVKGSRAKPHKGAKRSR